MDEFDCFCVLNEPADAPRRFPDPFDKTPQYIAQKAAELLQHRLNSDSSLCGHLWSENGGKMFGVLVVMNEQGVIGYLAAFSGMLKNRWLHNGFVPPVFDIEVLQEKQRQEQRRLDSFNQQINDIELDQRRKKLQLELSATRLQAEKDLEQQKKQNRQNKRLRDSRRKRINQSNKLLDALASQSQREKSALKSLKQDWADKIAKIEEDIERSFEERLQYLKTNRTQLSQKLHREIFDSYKLINKAGRIARLVDIFEGEFPPGGAADCAAPKLFQFAYKNQYQPLAVAEFWWGAPQRDEMRFSGHFYPPCRRKCASILPFYLEGLDIKKGPGPEAAKLVPDIVFEDDHLLVLDKPAGMLSVPGKAVSYSVASWLSDRFPDVTGPMLVHRLDMATSGLLLAAKNRDIHKYLQKQFIQRTLDKRYVAVLSKPVSTRQKIIELPLRVNLDDRPRQMVCHQFGKPARTDVEIVAMNLETTRVHLYPRTGRTHQLRVHAVHPDGLNAPIVGDSLYGEAADRLYLHAESLQFQHPVTLETMRVESTAPF